jgi:hypothetical protein
MGEVAGFFGGDVGWGEGVDGLLQAMVEVVWWPKARKTRTEVFY